MAAVDIEVVLIRWESGTLRHRSLRRPLGDGERPDDAALHLAAAGVGAVSHSTSWRHDAGTVVLTYAVLPDPCPAAPSTALTAPSVVCSDDPLRPAPDQLHAHHIAAHAVRHLAYLADTDPTVAAVANRSDECWAAECWAAVRRTGAGIPAGVHEAAHRLAVDLFDDVVRAE